jgi:hypothetical protein
MRQMIFSANVALINEKSFSLFFKQDLRTPFSILFRPKRLLWSSD